jgi:hypothetical protein
LQDEITDFLRRFPQALQVGDHVAAGYIVLRDFVIHQLLPDIRRYIQALDQGDKRMPQVVGAELPLWQPLTGSHAAQVQSGA